jgi:predicted esterase
MPAPTILLLHEPGAAETALFDLVAALRARDAEVTVMACQAPYDAVLDVVAVTERVLFWRRSPEASG